jgi:hypothetical protein
MRDMHENINESSHLTPLPSALTLNTGSVAKGDHVTDQPNTEQAKRERLALLAAKLRAEHGARCTIERDSGESMRLVVYDGADVFGGYLVGVLRDGDDAQPIEAELLKRKAQARRVA